MTATVSVRIRPVTRRLVRAIALLCLLGAAMPVLAEPVLQAVKLADDVYALVGPTTDRDPRNLGNNANFGVVITGEGVVLVDPGATYRGARMIHDAVRALTDQPVRIVINTGGQDHRWLGNGYFQALGARVIANENAVADQRARLNDQLARLGGSVGDQGMAGTEAAYADETFAEQSIVELGGKRIEIHHAGPAHTPGDSFVWLPAEKILFSGDIVYVDRMLSLRPYSAHRSWIAAFEAMAARDPEVVVPGHGRPTTLDQATADTYDYLVFLRTAVQQLIDDGNGMEAIGQIDQSRFDYLANYEVLKGRNAQRVYEEIEWE
jgi:glyoxylase-like metal-dependent hydrolase (beta-lactamase superfamily II)